MNWNLFIIFCLLNVANVIIQTVKSLATIKCGKTVAALVNAVAYGLYTVVVVYTVCDLALWLKVLVVAVANLIGVFVVKWLEEKSRKDKLWLVKITIPKNDFEKAKYWLKTWEIPYSYVDIEKYVVFDTYCATQKDTEFAIKVCKMFNGKMFATENKL